MGNHVAPSTGGHGDYGRDHVPKLDLLPDIERSPSGIVESNTLEASLDYSTLVQAPGYALNVVGLVLFGVGSIGLTIVGWFR